MSTPRRSAARPVAIVLAVVLGACSGGGSEAALEPTRVDPPAERAEVHRPGSGHTFVDEFEGSGPGIAWRPPPGNVQFQDGECVIDLGRSRDGGRAVDRIAMTPIDVVDPAQSQLWLTCVRYVGAADRVRLCELAGVEREGSFRVELQRTGSDRGLDVVVETGSSERLEWTDGRWGSQTGRRALTTEVDDEYMVVGVEIDADARAPRLRALVWSRAVRDGSFDQGTRLFVVTDWVPWSRVYGADEPTARYGLGGGDASTGRLHYEWVRFAGGPPIHAWVNGKGTAQGSYDTRHWRSYDGQWFVPVDGERPALPHGSEDAWDGHYAKDAWIVQDEDGLYYLFHSGKPKGGAYSIGVARSASVNGPWVKYEGNPILANRPGTDESGLQFPAVVKDVSHPDPEWRWQMLYDGYDFDPVRHSIFLATAPEPLGPWTRRGAVLGAGAAGEFDDLGCAGGIPLWWDGQWEVWYPALQRRGDSGVWTIARATGPSLERLERDGFGPRVRQASGAEGRLTGPIEGRFVPLDDTRGFARDGVVLITDDGVKNNYVTSRVRRVVPGGIELYHSVSGFDPARPTIVRQFDRASLWPRQITRVGDEWWLYINLFGTFRGAQHELQTFDENTALLKHSAADPSGATFEFDWPVNPPIARGVNNNDRSSENIALITTPVIRE